MEGEEAGLQNGNDFYVYFGGDLTQFSDITIEVDNGQDDPLDPTEGAGVEAISPILVNNLQGGNSYTITITAFCENGEPQVLTFEIDVPFGENPTFCGQELYPYDISSYTLLSSLTAGETFLASDFIINVKEVKGSYGRFSGHGYVKIPYFKQARLNVQFKNITISNQKRMIDGYIVINGFGLALLGDDISDAINGSLDEIINGLEDISEILEELIPILEDIEELVNTSGHLVDPEIVACIETHKNTLEELEEELKNNTSLSEEELEGIKQEIKSVSALLKVCIDQFNEALETILTSVVQFIPFAIEELYNSCDIDLLNQELDQLKLANPNIFLTPDELEVALDEFIENSEGTFAIPAFENTYSFDYQLNEPVEDNLENQIITQFYEKEQERNLCILLEDINGYINDENNPVLVEELKLILKVLSNLSAETINTISTKVKEEKSKDPNFNDWQLIFDDVEVGLKQAFKLAILQYIYNK